MAAQEQKKGYHVTKDFAGVNTKANRTAVKEEEFAWLENAMPVGHGNIRIVPAPSTIAGITFLAAVSYTAYGNIGTTNYFLAFQTDGSCEVVNLTTNTKTSIAAAGTFSASGMSATNWNNTLVLIIDPVKGYFTWDGTTLKTFTGAIQALTISSLGKNYTKSPILSFSSGSATATTTIFLTQVEHNAGGSNYKVGDVLNISGGTYTTQATLIVTSVSGTGAVTGTAVNNGGVYTVAPSTPAVTVSLNGSVGTGCTVGGGAKIFTFSILAATITNAGSGYSSAPTVTVTNASGDTTGADGAVTASITGAPATGSAIASFSGRVWIVNGRTIYYSSSISPTDFVTVSAGNITLNDATLIGNITNLVSANNFLYIFGQDSINVFSDVRVGSTGVTTFTNTNISASVGSDLPYATMPYFRSIVFMNRYGMYALVGSTTSKLSDGLDGIFPYIDFTKTITAGPVLINNILCAAFSFTYNDPLSSARVIQAVYFDKKWFFTSQSEITWMTSVPINGAAKLYATTGTNLKTLFTDKTVAISSKIQPALLPMGDNIRDKQALKFGVEAILSDTNASSITVTVDNENRSSSGTTLSNTFNVSWINSSSITVNWINSSLSSVYWYYFINGYYLYRYDAQQWGKYIGMTITSTSPNFIVSGVQYETELRARF